MENLINKKFNFLTVISGPIIKNKKTYWHCKCDCGQEKDIRADLLKNGSTKSCGCYKKNILIKNNIKRQTVDLSNQRFGKIIALNPTEERSSDHRVIWNCKCDCGKYFKANSHDLQQGKILSCGCLKSAGELEIENLLIQNHIIYEKQKKFIDCKFEDTDYYVIFDFYVNNNYIIEYDGEQHYYYKNNHYTWNTKENYLKNIEHDKFKNDWCKKNNIPIIRIPYTKKNNIKLEDLLLETSQYIII